jgi:GH25 family lysozyme M1 (1,4-beta-N-acetylmuramidase)
MYNGCFDISHYNGPIKWSQVPDTYRLVFIKASEGSSVFDTRFTVNAEGAIDSGRMVVPYHFVTFAPAKAQAENFFKAASIRTGGVTMLDWEENVKHEIPPVETVESIIKAVEDATGRLPIMYHGLYTLKSPKINACPWNVPKYGPMPHEQLKWAFWQNTPKGHVPGINGPVDHDCWNGNETELDTFYATGALPKRLKSAPPPWAFE